MKWVIDNIFGIIGTLAIIVMIAPKIKSYFTSVSYEDNIIFTRKIDSLKLTTPQAIKLKYETDNSFMPMEDITVTATLAVFEPLLLETAKKQRYLFVRLDGATLRDNRINKKNVFGDQIKLDKDSPLTVMDFNANNAPVVLYPTSRPNEFKGKAVVYYNKPGAYKASLTYMDNPPANILDTSVEIGSTVEVMNKKTNDLLFIIAIISFIAWIVTTFFSQTKP